MCSIYISFCNAFRLKIVRNNLQQNPIPFQYLLLVVLGDLFTPHSSDNNSPETLMMECEYCIFGSEKYIVSYTAVDRVTMPIISVPLCLHIRPSTTLVFTICCDTDKCEYAIAFLRCLVPWWGPDFFTSIRILTAYILSRFFHSC